MKNTLLVRQKSKNENMNKNKEAADIETAGWIHIFDQTKVKWSKWVLEKLLHEVTVVQG